MTRLARRATLLVSLCLLTSAATAYAECAWVLWEISSPTGTNREWSYDKIDAEATNAACKQRADVAIHRRTLQGRIHGWTVTRGEANRLEFSKADAPEHFFADFQSGPTPWTRAGRRESERGG